MAKYDGSAVWHTGPGTLAGRFLRRFWQPIHLSRGVHSGRAVAVRIMSEDFTLYRDEGGEPHLLDARCAHRGTQLSVGWVEGDSIRCLVNWALAFAMQPTKDIRIIPDRPSALDPSACSPDRENEFHRSTSSAILIDATRKWPYPPVGLPKKEYMENALHLWKELGLPELKLKTPWYGYELGNWTKEDRDYADLIVRGEYLAVGEKLAGRAITRP